MALPVALAFKLLLVLPFTQAGTGRLKWTELEVASESDSPRRHGVTVTGTPSYPVAAAGLQLRRINTGRHTKPFQVSPQADSVTESESKT